MNEHMAKPMHRLPIPRAHKMEPHKPSSVKLGTITAIVVWSVGLLFLFITEKIHRLFPYIASCILILAGTFDVYRGIKTKEYQNAETKLLANGIVYLILGFAILYHREESAYMIGALWGVLSVVKGSEALNTAFHQVYLKTHFVKELIRAAIELLLGILLLIDAPSSIPHHISLLGIELLLVGWRILQDTKILRNECHDNSSLT